MLFSNFQFLLLFDPAYFRVINFFVRPYFYYILPLNSFIFQLFISFLQLKINTIFYNFFLNYHFHFGVSIKEPFTNIHILYSIQYCMYTEPVYVKKVQYFGICTKALAKKPEIAWFYIFYTTDSEQEIIKKCWFQI